VRCTSILV